MSFNDKTSHLPKVRLPSSASTGMFMTSPKLENQYREDSSLDRVISLFLPASVIQDTSSDLSRFGEEVLSKRVLGWISDAERNVPYVKGSGRDAFGRRTDELVTSEGWRNLQTMGLKEGTVAIGYENRFAEYSRVVQFVKYHIWTGSSAFVTCPSAMQDGAASLLKRHLATESKDSPLSSAARDVLKVAFARLTARDEKAWTSGQWMTERIGGSDVSGTETLATYSPFQPAESFEPTQLDGSPLGPWIIDGFKWFSSATDSQMTIAMAQTQKGLSAFYIPMRRTNSSGDSELNGIQISRLKSKLGTKAVPTAELELKSARGYLLGEEGNGVREISTMLNITRVHNSVTSMGLLGRGLAIAKAFANVREMAGKGNKRTLKDVPLHIHTLAEIILSYRANMLFTFFTVYCLGISDQAPSSNVSDVSCASLRLRPKTSADLQLILRLLTPALKALTAKASISGLQECIEALGGVGYLDNEESQHINVSRLYRDANVLSIWEGTTNVLGTDFVKILKGRNGENTLRALNSWVKSALFETGPSESAIAIEKHGIISNLRDFQHEIKAKGIDELTVNARGLMERFAVVVSGTLMAVDAESDGDPVSLELFKRFSKVGGFGDSSERDWKAEVDWGSKIVFGGPSMKGIQAHL